MRTQNFCHAFRRLSSFIVICGIPTAAWAQGGTTTGAAAAPAPTPGTPTGNGPSGGGNLAFESQAIAYEALQEVACQISFRVLETWEEKNSFDDKSCTGKSINGKENGKSKSLLLATPTNLAAISSFLTFAEAAHRLRDAYKTPGSGGTLMEGVIRQQERSGLPLATVTPLIAPITGFLTAAKATTTQTSGTFNASDQALQNDLEKAFIGTDVRLVLYPSPKALASASRSIDELFSEIEQAKEQAAAPKNKDEEEYIKQLDKQVSDLKATLVSTNPASGLASTILGAALLRDLATEMQVTCIEIERNKAKKEGKTFSVTEEMKEACLNDVSRATYHSLSVTNDVAGGGNRANTYFLLNLFVPAPHASYNGGAVVSYSFRNEEGDPQAAGTLRFVFGYGKWHEPSLRKRSDEEGYANFTWHRKQHRGGWIVWW